MINNLFENIMEVTDQSYSGRLRESSIDFARKDLDPQVWKNEGNSYILQPQVKERILNVLGQYPGVDLVGMAQRIAIVGSITSNQYQDDADIDVHIVPKDITGWDAGKVTQVQQWFNVHRDDVDGWVGSHPIEIYIQTIPAQDDLSVGVYDIQKDTWLVGPKKVDLDYDPYDDFSNIADDVRSSVKNADSLFGELRRDIIDYDTIKQAMGRLSGDAKQKLLNSLRNKLEELEDNITALYGERGKWVAARRGASKPKSSQQALHDVELVKKWQDENAIFKFINRYKYLKIINGLEELLSDDKISPNEIDKIKRIMGGVG